ncbi:hypothetical protein C1I97_06515, partial [Streptomyces sp. NTH33]|uniref:hypothetical protein n=1 Tax=Streptomyces sp. NTH33 TaxID=1735453 RepID=UPI000DB13AC4
IVPLLHALLAGTTEPDALDPWCPEHLGVTLGRHTVDIRSTPHTPIRYIQRLFTPATELWHPHPAAADPDLILRCIALPRSHVAALAQHVRAHATGAARKVRMHVNAPATWYELSGCPALTPDPAPSIAPQIIARHRTGYTIITCDDADASMNTARHLREMGYRLAEDRGWVCFHASAAVLDGRGVLIPGNSGSGKSSLALALATADSGAFLANDRTLTACSPGRSPRAIALPGPIRLNGGTLHALGLDQVADWNLTRSKPAHDTDWQSFRGDSKLHVLPAEWAEHTGTPLTAEAAVHAIVFPDILPDSHTLTLDPLPPEEARKRLAAQCMSPHDDVYTDDWLDTRSSPITDLTRTASRVLDTLAQLTAFTLHFGTGTPYADVTAAVHRHLAAPVTRS